MEITLKIETNSLDKEQKEALLVLFSLKKDDVLNDTKKSKTVVDEEDDEVEVPVKKSRSSKSKKPVIDEEEYELEEDTKKSKSKKPVVDEEDDFDDEDEDISIEDLRKAVADAKSSAGSIEPVKVVFKKYGASGISALDKKHYRKVIKELKAL